MTASSSPEGGPGHRTRREPSSRTRKRRVMPALAWTASAMRPTARLAAKVCVVTGTVAGLLTLHPLLANSNRHCALERRLVHGVAGAGIDDRAAVHHHEMVAQLACEVEILLDQYDRDLPQIAQIGDGAADILDDRRLDALGRLIQQQELWPH